MIYGKRIQTKEEKHKWDLFYKLGMTNGWMNGKYAEEDGNFIVESDRLNKKSGFVITNKDELKQFFKHGNWCLGTSVMYKDFCFMQQINGGDEYWVVKYDKGTDTVFSFESWSCNRMIEDGTFDKNLKNILKATNEQLKKLSY